MKHEPFGELGLLLQDADHGRFLDPHDRAVCDGQGGCQAQQQAQEAKKRHIAAKLLIEPGLRVLDIGCGWGGLTLSLAEMERVEVVGVSHSRAEQLTVARKRAKQARLEERVRFALKDYREIEGRFDRIVSVARSESCPPEVAPVIERAGLVPPALC